MPSSCACRRAPWGASQLWRRRLSHHLFISPWPALLLALAAAAGAQPDAAPLSLATAVQEALAHSPRVTAEQQAVARLRAEAAAAGALPATRLELAPLVSDERGFDLDAALTQTLFDPTVSPARQVARAAVAAQLLVLAETRLEVAAETRLAYHRLAAAVRQVEALEQDHALARTVRQAAVSARDLGERPGIDVLRADLDLGLTEQALQEARVGAGQARAALNSLLGRQPAAELVVEPSTPVAAFAPDRAALTRAALDRPRLQLAARVIEERQRRVALTRAQRLPAVDLTAFREDQEHGLQFVFSLPLFDSGRLRGETRAAQAGVQEAVAQLEQARREAALEVERAVLAAESAMARRATFERDLLATAERLATLVERGYRVGELSLMEVLDARRRLADVRRTAVELELAVAEAVAALERAAGVALPQGGAR